MRDGIYPSLKGRSVSVSVKCNIQLCVCAESNNTKLRSAGAKLKVTSQGFYEVLLLFKISLAHTARLVHQNTNVYLASWKSVTFALTVLYVAEKNSPKAKRKLFAPIEGIRDPKRAIRNPRLSSDYLAWSDSLLIKQFQSTWVWTGPSCWGLIDSS